jgi:hypothetical protein
MIERKCIEVDNKANARKVELRPSSNDKPQLASATQNSDSPASQKVPSESTAKNLGTISGPITSFGQSPDAKKASPPPEQGLYEHVKHTVQKKGPPAAQEETIKDVNNNSMVPIAKEKPSETNDKTPATKEEDSTPAANEESQPATVEAASRTCKQVKFDSEPEVNVFHDAATQSQQDSGDAQMLGPNNTQPHNNTNNSIPKYNPDQYQALIALHRTDLHEYHDFFLASQHPAASRALKHLARKYAMPARMWKHGVEAFLEVLRHRLPDSMEPMLAFIYLAYSMFTLLLETVPAFKYTWAECLGDIARHRLMLSLLILHLKLWILT